MAFRYPRLQQQLHVGDPYGRFNCTAYGVATAGDADSGGKLVYTGRQIRAASDEAVPDGESPGLNLNQAAAALFRLSRGRIDLDVHPWNNGHGSPWTVPQLAIAGRWISLAVWRGVLVDAGVGGGDDFRQGHCITVGYDQVRKLPMIGDPLIPEWMATTWATLYKAANQLLVIKGAGSSATGTYFASTRDVYDAPADTLRRSAIFEAGSFWLYTVTGGVVRSREPHRFNGDTSAPCTAPVEYQWNGRRVLVQITAGRLRGRWVQPGTSHVRMEVHK